jgi:ribonuclease BN (tRNA processing enzyme)
MRRIIFLGAGTPTPHRRGFGTAFFLDIDGHGILVDCGPSTTQKLAQSGFSPLDVNSLFLTHLHFDHCSGMPDLLLSYWDQSVSSPLGLKIYGPEPSQRFVDRLIGPAGAFSDDIDARIHVPISQKTFINRGGALPRHRPEFVVNELAGGETFKVAKCLVTARKVQHAGPWLESLAYRFDIGEVSVVISGDTGSVNVIAELAAECDVLIVNVWNANADVSSSPNDESLATISTAALMAKKASAKTLVLAHLGTRNGQKGEKTDAECISEAAKIFSGNIVVAKEGKSLILQKLIKRTLAEVM